MATERLNDYTRTENINNENGQQVATIEHKPYAYCVSWRTEKPSTEVLESLRGIYAAAEVVRGGDFRRATKFPTVINLLSPDGCIMEKMPVEAAGDERLRNKVAEVNPSGIQISTNYLIICFSPRDEQKANLVVMSHLSLAPQLASLIQQTSAVDVPAELPAVLQKVVDKYHQD